MPVKKNKHSLIATPKALETQFNLRRVLHQATPAKPGRAHGRPIAAVTGMAKLISVVPSSTSIVVI